MVESIRVGLENSLATSPWMDAATTLLATNKAKALRVKVGYPDWLMNDTLLTEHYALLNVTGLYTSNKLNAARFQVSAMLAKLGTAVDRDAWDMVLRVIVCACHFLMLSPPNESHM